MRRHHVIGAVLIASGLVHLAILLGTGGSWDGPVSWRKPATFGLSFGLTLITLAWVASLMPPVRRWSLDLLSAACVLEVGLITVQAWRGVPSHFNLSTTVDGLIARTLAAGGAAIIVVVAVLTAASWRRDPAAPQSRPQSLRLALRAGFLSLDAALVIGAVMIAKGIGTAMGGDQQGAYATGGSLKPAHFITMHGVLLLPLLARCAAPEATRLRLVRVAALGYAVLAAVVTAESVAGVDPLHGPLAGTVLGLAGGLAVAGACVAAIVPTVVAVRRTHVERRAERDPSPQVRAKTNR